MSTTTLKAIFTKLLGSNLVQDRLAVVWHAGEPLTVPVSWYENAFAIAESCRRPNQVLQHVFQSNGTLLDKDWVSFFQRTNARISLSIDGPAWLHDCNRQTRNGRGTHAKAMRGLSLLHEADIRPAIITVLTRAALDHADALFDFYRQAGIEDVAFNIEEIEGSHTMSTLSDRSTEQAYRAFLHRFIDRMRAEPGSLSLRELRDARGTLAYGVANGHNQEAEPLRIISIGRDGAVSTFSPELLGMHHERYGNYTFGNIETDDLAQIEHRVLASTMHRDIVDGIGHCRRTCGWFNWCGGGSPSNKIFEAGTAQATETMYCRLTRQSVLDVVMSAWEHSPIPASVHG